MKISVIVPVYKVEKYLCECIDSILNQTFTDFELILVDDGSPDNCPKICDEYAKKDSRIIVIHKENGGVSSARNAGIDFAINNSNSVYIAFVDGDDCVAPLFLDDLYSCISQSKSDAVKIRYAKSKEDLDFYNGFDSTKLQLFNISNNEKRRHFFDIYLFRYKPGWEIYTCLFSKNIIKTNNIRFPVGLDFAEDLYFSIVYFSYCELMVYLPKRLYFYRQREGSMMSSTTGCKLNELNEISKLLIRQPNSDRGYSCLLHKNIIFSRTRLLPPLDSVGSIKIWKNEIEQINDKDYFKSLLNRAFEIEKKKKRLREKITYEWASFIYLKSFNAFKAYLLIVACKIKLFFKKMLRR